MNHEAGDYGRRKIDAYVEDLEHVLLESVLHEAQLEEGLTTRALIGEAIGILMVKNHCTADEAFEVLKRASQNSNIKLREIAFRLVRAVDNAGE